MKVRKQLVSIQIENPLSIGGELLLNDDFIGEIRGLSTLSLEGVEAGIHTLSLSTPRGIIKNTLTAREGETHTLHMAYTYYEEELTLRYREGAELLREHRDLYRVRELASVPDLIRRKQEDAKTLLHLAVDFSNYEGAKVLLEGGADPNVRDHYLTTPLMSAVERSNIDLVKLLLKHGARVETVDSHNEIPLMKGINTHSNALNIIRLLVEQGSPVDTMSRSSGLTPLHMALRRRGCREAALLLIEEGADTGIRDGRGYSSIDLALEGGDPLLIKTLMEKGIVPVTPLSLFKAVKTRDLAIAEYIFSHFQETDITSEHGITPLMLCCSLGFSEGVKWLLDQGAHCDRRDFQGETPLFYALHHPDICAVLIEYGADTSVVNHRGESPLMKLIPEKFRESAALFIS